jgi:hypothetical protein
MANVSDDHGKYRFHADYALAGSDQATWTAMVYDGDRLCGTTRGTIHNAAGPSEKHAQLVKIAVHSAIDGSCGLDLEDL